ncbi:MAG: D-sedoheptulose 7-phosphate isomerase [Desulfobacterales bacterium]
MFENDLDEHIDCFNRLDTLKNVIVGAGSDLAAALKSGRKILICGNGGSAADAQHFAGEIVGRFTRERRAWPAMALTTDSSIVSALANDYGYETVFARQVEAHGCPGDVLIGISTSGNSENVIRALETAKAGGMKTISLSGAGGGALKETADIGIVVPAEKTARIQEAHIFILHCWAEMIETIMLKGEAVDAGLS